MPNYQITSKTTHQRALACLAGILTIAASVNGGDINSDNMIGEPPQNGEFSLSEHGISRADSMAAFAGAILHSDEATSMPYLFKAVAANPDSPVLMRYLTDKIRKSKNRKVYQEQLEQLAWRNPDSLRLVLSAVIIMVAEKNKEKALELADKCYKTVDIQKLPPDQMPLFISLVRLLGAFQMESGKFANAVAIYDQVLAAPQFADDPQLLEAGAVVYDRAAKKADKDSFLWFNSDRENLEEKRDEVIVKLESLTLKKYDPLAFNALYSLYNTINQPERAFQVILKRLVYEPDNRLLRKMLALTFYKQKNYQLSLYTWQSMAAERILEPVDYMMYGEAAWKAREYGLAKAALVQYMQKNPRNFQARLMLGMVLYDAGEEQKALDLLKAMPVSTVVMHLKSMILMRMKKYAEALQLLQQIEKIYVDQKKSPTANLYLSMSYMAEKVNRIDLFEEYTRMLYKLEPDKKAEWDNSLGYVLADHNIRLQEAEKLLRSAVAANKNPENLDSLAWVLFKLKKFAEARKYIMEAIELQHDIPDAVIADHAGDILAANGNKQDALKYWRLALIIYGEEVDHAKVRTKIAALEKQ
jgi:tetratricopeptide (TPR) repeat protein